ncbi:DgyrCDS2001 [Dimorphilus gyrociliatus]|uniref:DgyrCDS2001 n=1 Tax=Dimorphilus gyrociliatus TaxID=2664684 RepID=A0A7I8VAY0_9ANNE|nr:DgyrCDS2001 [Dimorphilus gyrociliatus]
MKIYFVILLIYAPIALSSSLKGERYSRRKFTEFMNMDPNVTVSPGDRAILRCKVAYLGTKKIQWTREKPDGSADMLTVGKFVFFPDDRYSIDYNYRTNEWQLIITDVRPEDDGIYKCGISSRHSKSFSFRLRVRTVSIYGHEFYEVGSSIRIVCNATGRPHAPDDILWLKNGRAIDEKSSRILITKRVEKLVIISVMAIEEAEKGDQGEYKCVSTNQDSAEIKLVILNGSCRSIRPK